LRNYLRQQKMKYTQILNKKILFLVFSLYFPYIKDDLKNEKSKLELKISGEQNRILLSNIRPSYYRDKIDAPLLSHLDDTVKNTSTFIGKSNISKQKTVMSSQTVGTLATKENPIIIKFKDCLGLEKFGKIRDLFEQYSAYSGKLHYMDSHEFHSFMKDNNLYSEECPKITMDLLFSKNNKSKESIFFLYKI